MGTGSPIRRCPECGEEFMPHVVNCSDCGTPLVSAYEGEEPPAAAGAPPPEDPAEYVSVVSGLTSEAAAEAARHFAAAGIAFATALDARRGGLRLGVARARVREAMEVLEREGIVPRQPDSAEGAVALEGGPCPACGDPVQPGTAECPGCGLHFSSPVPQCEHCGADVDPAFDACPECGREQA
jgi:predicted amidophosphoribosyltransferase